MRRVLLVRHAECEMNLNVAHYVGGRTNESPLTPLGQRQAAALGKHFNAVARTQSVGPVFASTAVRAVQTARIVLETLKASAPITQHDDLLELDQGEWQGKARKECYTDEVVARIAQDPWNFAPPGGESQRQVEERMLRYIKEKVLPQVVPGGPPALVVSHGLAIKCVLRSVLGSRPAMTRHVLTHNTSVAEVVWLDTPLDGPQNVTWQVQRINDVSHLLMEGVQF